MEDPLRIAVCEDTPADAEKLLDLLQSSPIPTQCTLFKSGEDLLSVYKPQMFDLLLTDIYMGGMTGIEAVSRIREMDEAIPVAFVTTSLDHTLESYRLSALMYIEKPYRDRQIESMLKLALLEKENAPSITVRRNGQELKIPLSRIQYLEQQTHHLSIILTDGELDQIYDRLSVFSPYLQENGFFIPHKSFAVNVASICSIDQELRCFIMKNGKNIPIRRESMGKAKAALKEYLFRSARSVRE